jgi:predicted RNase H-like HicB family nuclease
MLPQSFTAIIEKEDNLYVALCPELDIASQGDTIEKAKAKLQEAVELFLECADAEEVQQRLCRDVYITRFDVNPLPSAPP